MHAGQLANEISREKVKHRTECRAPNETFAPLPSSDVLVLWGRTSITECRQVSSWHESSGLATELDLFDGKPFQGFVFDRHAEAAACEQWRDAGVTEAHVFEGDVFA